MNISPASVNAVTSFAPASYLVDDAGVTAEISNLEPANALAAPADVASTLQSGVAALEQRFTAFTKRLTRELARLEHQFSTALRSLVNATKRAVPTSHSDSLPVDMRGKSAASPYDGIIRRAAARNGIDPALVDAVVRQESGFRPDAVSSAGAVGLMQLMPSTARDLGVTDPLDATQNVNGGARLLRSLLDRYGGRLDFALAAYNAGPAAVDRYGGVPPYPETQSYVQAIMADYRASALDS
jgi:soluble lytic murein transglycosylase-like protein